MKKLLYLLAFLPIAAPAMEKIAGVEHSTTSVILRFELYDQAGAEDCNSAITFSTSGLEINVSSDVTNGYIDQFRQSDSTLETVVVIGTYATPTATKARLRIIAANACTYELQLPDSIFATSNANILTITITDGTTLIIDSVYWVDLTPVSLSTLVNAQWDEPTAGNITAGTFGAQLKTVLDTINTLLGTVDTNIDTVNTNTSAPIFVSGVADSGDQTSLVDIEDLAGFEDHFFNNYTHIIIQFSGGSETRCVRGFVDSTDTISWFPATSGNVNTETYKLVAAPECRNFP